MLVATPDLQTILESSKINIRNIYLRQDQYAFKKEEEVLRILSVRKTCSRRRSSL